MRSCQFGCGYLAEAGKVHLSNVLSYPDVITLNNLLTAINRQ